MAERRPDVHELFLYYNSLYFDEALGTCIVSWVPRMNRIVATCDCTEAGLCEIKLSETLLKPCSSADLKNTLLHEMIHAFLWIKKKNNNHSDHGPNFLALASSINSNCKDDVERPSDGYKITMHHGFQSKTDNNDNQQWMRASNGDLIKRGTGREPLPYDCIEDYDYNGNCGNMSCESNRHKKLCFGRDAKLSNFSKFENKGQVVEVSQDNQDEKHKGLSSSTRQARKKLFPVNEVNDNCITKRKKILTRSFQSVGDTAITMSKKTFCGDCSSYNQSIALDSRSGSLFTMLNFPKQQRSLSTQKWNICNTEDDKFLEHGREITLAMPLFGVYTDEESEDDPEPLINKRSQRRMKLNNEDVRNDAKEQTGFASCEVIFLD
ncbi:hypothetical protein HPP92_007821 [Vanilla planifolia]|uniref:SprT-like domain-containing protein n=1 Tax=Vanilla planifolia TaxID=51239 RepID=A0A835VB21_VANPL|nr:hypothetical protein HPP92_007821 [Vanilla planifolia]